jgi:phosphatidylserine/phosphatidylglycerophosphate/cardiolipin synthase-like enzyme
VRYALLLLLLLTACVLETQSLPLTGAVVTSVRDEGTIEVHFCPREPCEQLMIDFLNQATDTVYCALYDFNLNKTQDFLRRKDADVRIVVDEDNARKVTGLQVVNYSGSGLMHNKFCVVDGRKVMTGSMNPTLRDTTKNNNNLLFIESDVIAARYTAEFWELWNREKDALGDTSTVLLGNASVAVYFCPEDDCADKVIEELRDAHASVYFMTFSFTHSGIANALLLGKERGVAVRGVYEKTQLSEYTTFDTLQFQDADVLIDGNPTNMHHKVFIIDGLTVVTGSFNPTKGGDERNDENLVIIKDAGLASEFLEEFEKVYGEAVAR